MPQKKDWFKLKRYPHIGLPILNERREDVMNFIYNKVNIAHYAFLPLIRREQITHRYKMCDDGKKRKRKKSRNISYASHLDSLIYSFYSFQLGKKYENYLAENKLCESIIAYRAVPRKNFGSKCNIDFAKESFAFINEKAQSGALGVIVSDITSFFDNLDHRLLKYAWKKICQKESLDDDEYNVFKNVTRFSYVYDKELFNLFKDEMVCVTKHTNKYKHKKIKRLRYCRDKNVVAFCERKDIRQIREKGLIIPNRTKDGISKGIPQGLPISAVLANIYMCDFDCTINAYIESIGGMYRRYSDDVLVVCPYEKVQECKEMLKNEIEKVKLEISENKTKTFYVHKEGDAEVKVECNGKDSVIEYLGFAYNGRNIRIKNKGLSHYYLRMNKSIRRMIYHATHKNDKTYGFLFQNQLLKRYTPTGSKRHKIWIRRQGSKEFYNSKRYSYGNFWTYANKAATICKDDAIRKQLKRNKAILHKKIKLAKEVVRRRIEQKQLSEIAKYNAVYSEVVTITKSENKKLRKKIAKVIKCKRKNQKA